MIGPSFGGGKGVWVSWRHPRRDPRLTAQFSSGQAVETPAKSGDGRLEDALADGHALEHHRVHKSLDTARIEDPRADVLG
jgi:hypothetical protein